MKITAALLLAFMSFGLFTSSTTAKEGIKFYNNLEEAKKVALEENKLIFLDAYASWCGPCKMMDRNVFKNAQVSEYYNSNYINVKIDFDKNPKLRRHYKVRAYPTLLYLNADGTVKKMKVGYHDAPDFLKIGKKLNN